MSAIFPVKYQRISISCQIPAISADFPDNTSNVSNISCSLLAKLEIFPCLQLALKALEIFPVQY
jgi:hypothetical protein